MKLFKRIFTLNIIYIIFFCNIINCQKNNNNNRPTLKYNENGKFKIVQFTDLHYGEEDRYDELNLIVQEKVIETEMPDFVMLSGDMFSGYAIDEVSEFHRLWEVLTRPMRSRNIPWAFTFGNHDCEGPMTGRELVEMDQLSSNLSLTQSNENRNIQGVTNYKLDIKSSRGGDNGNLNVSSSIYVFDSDLPNCNENEVWGCIDSSQVEWYKNESNKVDAIIPSIAFVHIPPVEIIQLWNTETVYGDFGDSESCCYYTEQSKFIDTMVNQGDIKFLGFGHDHKNDYHGLWMNTIQLGYGRKTGYGSYNPKYLEGARIIELTEEKQNATTKTPFSIKTWIRNGLGEIEQQKAHFPSSFSQIPLVCGTGQEIPDPWIEFLIAYCVIVILVTLVVYKLKTRKLSIAYKPITIEL